MKRKIVSGIMLTLLLIGMLTLAINILPVKAEPKTWYVDDDGGADFTKIQDAVYAASAGDTIYVYNGTYHEHIYISKSLTLIGENKYATIIDGSGYGPVVKIYARSVNLISFTVRNAGWGEPPPLGIAVYLYYASLCNISDNIVLNSRHGIAVLFYSQDNIISNNTISGAEFGIVNFNPWRSYNNTVIDNRIWNCSNGIYFNYPYNIQVVGNIVSNNTRYPYGIHFQMGGYNNTVVGNRIENSENAIRLDYADGNFVGENVVSNNTYGLFVGYGSSDNIVSGNIASESTIGIMIWDNSNNNTVINNEALNNYYGIGLSLSSHNKIYHNNFLDNTYQVYSYDSVNVWDGDYPSGGNFWSDYMGVDANGDGIGDTSYVIDADNQDRYPLVHPWSSLPVHNINTGLGYATIQEAINADETQNGHTIFVEAGTYYENVIVDKPLSLIGENKDSTIIDGRSLSHVVDLKANSIRVSGFTLQNGATGIFAYHTNYHLIENNILQNNYDGIYLYGSLYNRLNDNLMTRNNFGFRIDESYSNTLRRNEMRDNIVYNFYFDLWGIIYDQHFIQDIDTSNTVDGKPIYWWMYQNGKRVPTDAGFVVLYRSSNIFIEDLELTKNNHGIVFLHTSSSSIENVTIWKCETGIALHVSNYNNIRGNRIANNGNGIILEKSSYNNVAGNNIENNGLGIITFEANNNRIYHNNFNNTYQVYNTEPYYSINSWDDGYPSGGNYWSDYTGVDADGDGIGDTPYVIDADNIDHYPLMNPWGAGTPVASFSWSPSAPEVGELVTFDASDSMPVGGEIVSYGWDFGDGSHASGKTVIHKYNTAGTYTVTLNVTDSEGLWDIEQKQIEVKAPPPPLTVSISPLSASILVGQSVTFTSTVSGGYTPYSFQWYLNGNPVSGATSNTWIFTPTTSGIYYIYLKVTDAKDNKTQSETARITVATVPVGGYSIPIQVQTKAEPVLPYIALIAILTAILTKMRPKTKRKR